MEYSEVLYSMYEICGGLRGVAWRTVCRRQLYNKKNISSLADTHLLFNMTDHMMNNTSDQNDVFLDILSDVMNRANGFDADVTISVDPKGAEAILKERQFGMFGNLPHEEVINIGGHACVLLIGLFKYLMAYKIPMGFVEETDKGDNTRNHSNISGTKTMDELLEKMKGYNPDNKPTKYGYVKM